MNPEIFDKAMTAFLEGHDDKEFVQRILNPELNTNPLQNPDGTTSTHSMAAEVDESGNWFVFPTVVNDNGGLRRIEDPQEARRFNQEKGEVIPFGKNAYQAIAFSQQYKTNKFKEFGRKSEQVKQNVKPVGNVTLNKASLSDLNRARR